MTDLCLRFLACSFRTLLFAICDLLPLLYIWSISLYNSFSIFGSISDKSSSVNNFEYAFRSDIDSGVSLVFANLAFVFVAQLDGLSLLFILPIISALASSMSFANKASLCFKVLSNSFCSF